MVVELFLVLTIEMGERGNCEERPCSVERSGFPKQSSSQACLDGLSLDLFHGLY